MSVMITLEQLGSEVRKKRGARRLMDIEKEVGVSASTLSRIERGVTPDLATVEKLAKWLGVNVRAAGGDETEIRSEEDLERAVEVYLRADKNLSEKTARTIAETVRTVMNWEIEKKKRDGVQ